MRYGRLVGVGGIGTGLFFALQGDHDLGRDESRPARRLDVRDYGKLHIVAHYPAVLLRARAAGSPFHVLPVGRVGADPAGEGLREEMAAAGMDVRFVRATRDRPTQLSVCFQYPDGSGGNITASDSAAQSLTPADVEEAQALLDSNTIALAVPEIPLDARRRLLERATEAGAFRVASFTSAELRKPESHRLLTLTDLVSLNEDEATVLAGRSFSQDAPATFLEAVMAAATAHQKDIAVLVTAGAHGAFGAAGALRDHVPALRVPVVSTAGAGDALLGGVVSGLALGLPLFGSSEAGLLDRPVESALDLGLCLATWSITSPHTIPPGLDRAALGAFARGLGVRFGAAPERLLQAAA